jgi:hypothetical protein
VTAPGRPACRWGRADEGDVVDGEGCGTALERRSPYRLRISFVVRVSELDGSVLRAASLRIATTSSGT